MPLLDARVEPRVWIGNAVKVNTHFDLVYNIACVAGGRRRFTLFPPEQIDNLYIAPLDFTPSGAPVSLVSVHESPITRDFRVTPKRCAMRGRPNSDPGTRCSFPSAGGITSNR